MTRDVQNAGWTDQGHRTGREKVVVGGGGGLRRWGGGASEEMGGGGGKELICQVTKN